MWQWMLFWTRHKMIRRRLWSQQLYKSQWTYSTVERKAIVALSSIKELYLYLCWFHFRIVRNHNTLIGLRGLHDVEGQLLQYILSVPSAFLTSPFNTIQAYKQQHGCLFLSTCYWRASSCCCHNRGLSGRQELNLPSPGQWCTEISCSICNSTEHTPSIPIWKMNTAVGVAVRDLILSVFDPNRGDSVPISFCSLKSSKISTSTSPWQCWLPRDKEDKGKRSRLRLLAWLYMY